MSKDNILDSSQRKTMSIVIAYPFGILSVSLVVNVLMGIKPYYPSIPTLELIYPLVTSAVFLVVNHSWLMTATELKRVRFRMYATPEEWAASNTSRNDIPELGIMELERVHNAHRNANENTLYFMLLCIAFIFSSPSSLVAYVWVVGFAVARLGYTYSYLAGKDKVRAFFMTMTLLTTYGLASYLVVSLFL